MKVISFILLVTFVVNGYSAPLIFKLSGEVDRNFFFDVATIDTSKYKEIKILVFIKSASAEVSVNGEEDIRFPLDMQQITKESSYSYTKIIDLPPTKTIISIKGHVKFYLYVYGIN